MVFEDTIRPTGFLDHQSSVVRRFVEQALHQDDLTAEEKAIRLYYAVRDNILYEIYGADMSRTGLRASAIIAAGSGLCIHKSIVYAAAVRSVGIPSRLVLTDVRNHLTSDRLRQFVGGDVFHYHCLVSVFIGGRWVKATPVFNRKLCQLYGMKPLEFDGKSDSLTPTTTMGRNSWNSSVSTAISMIFPMTPSLMACARRTRICSAHATGSAAAR